MKDLAKAMEACEKFDEMKEEFISTLCAAMKSRGLEQMGSRHHQRLRRSQEILHGSSVLSEGNRSHAVLRRT